MKSYSRSILARSLMAGAASLAFVAMAPGVGRAETVTVQGDAGAAGADGVNPGDYGMPGGDGESVAANAGGTQPITCTAQYLNGDGRKWRPRRRGCGCGWR